MQSEFLLTQELIDGPSLRQRLVHASAGALVCFEGWVRDHHQGKSVTRLHYSAHPILALEVGRSVLRQACVQFAIERALCVHRLGTLQLSEVAVWVGVCSAHRDSAFAACSFIIDEIKKQVPIWKHEEYLDRDVRANDGGSSWLHPLDV
jgi:molybdopterin synthase catalytic subunit